MIQSIIMFLGSVCLALVCAGVAVVIFSYIEEYTLKFLRGTKLGRIIYWYVYEGMDLRKTVNTCGLDKLKLGITFTKESYFYETYPKFIQKKIIRMLEDKITELEANEQTTLED